MGRWVGRRAIAQGRIDTRVVSLEARVLLSGLAFEPFSHAEARFEAPAEQAALPPLVIATESALPVQITFVTLPSETGNANAVAGLITSGDSSTIASGPVTVLHMGGGIAPASPYSTATAPIDANLTPADGSTLVPRWLNHVTLEQGSPTSTSDSTTTTSTTEPSGLHAWLWAHSSEYSGASTDNSSPSDPATAPGSGYGSGLASGHEVMHPWYFPWSGSSGTSSGSSGTSAAPDPPSGGDSSSDSGGASGPAAQVVVSGVPYGPTPNAPMQRMLAHIDSLNSVPGITSTTDSTPGSAVANGASAGATPAAAGLGVPGSAAVVGLTTLNAMNSLPVTQLGSIAPRPGDDPFGCEFAFAGRQWRGGAQSPRERRLSIGAG